MTEEKIPIAKEVIKALQELEESVQLENIIKDNKIEFTIEKEDEEKKITKIKYRVRKPEFTEQEEINKQKRKKYLELMEDDSYLFRKQWVKKYLKKGIDINKMEEDMLKLQSEIKSLLLKLAPLTESKGIETLKNEIMKLREKQEELNREKVDLMVNSIEDQMLIFANNYTAYLVLEKLELHEEKKEHVIINDNKWVKYFKDYKEFEVCEDWTLINKLFYCLNHLLYIEG